MEDPIKEEMKEIKKGKKQMAYMLATAMLVFVVTVGVVTWENGGFTGFAVQTFEAEYTTAAGSNPGSQLRFEKLPDIKVRKGEKIKIEVKANTDEKLRWSDNTQMFDIDQEGEIEFIAEKEGEHRIFVIVTNEKGDYYYQDFRMIIK